MLMKLEENHQKQEAFLATVDPINSHSENKKLDKIKYQYQFVTDVLEQLGQSTKRCDLCPLKHKVTLLVCHPANKP